MDLAVQPLVCSFQPDASVITGRMVGDFDVSDLAPFRAQVEEVTKGRRHDFSIDVSGLAFCGSAFVNCMLGIRHDFGHVALVNPTPALERVLSACGVDSILVVRHR